MSMRTLRAAASSAVAMAVLPGLAACSDTRVPGILEVVATASATDLTVGVNTCHQNPQVTVVRQDDAQVRLRVAAVAVSRGQVSCMDVAVVRLAAPLGQRAVIDDSTGRRVTVYQ